MEQQHPQSNDETTVNTTSREEPEILDAIARGIAGDQSGFADLYAHYASGVYRLCYSLLLNHQDAEDVVQEVFVYAFKNLHRYDPDRAAFKTWLYTITVSRCRNVYRRQRPLLVTLAQLFQTNISAPRSERPEAMMAERAAQDALVSALAALSSNLREAVMLRYGHGLTYREIAEVMNCPQKTAESRVRLAHERLRGVLEPVGEGLLQELMGF
ncbi:MAG: sigma-70 family RNA polymerase sigma factor [Aggregatilineales bacterium]